jgi:cytochrome c5
MKKWIILSFICAVGIIACGKKIMPESNANNQSKPANDKPAKEETKQTNTNTSANATPTFNNMQRTIPAGLESPGLANMEKGKTVYVTKCNTCHALKNPGDYTISQMNSILKAEIPKAKLNSQEADQVTAYLLANSKL